MAAASVINTRDVGQWRLLSLGGCGGHDEFVSFVQTAAASCGAAEGGEQWPACLLATESGGGFGWLLRVVVVVVMVAVVVMVLVVHVRSADWARRSSAHSGVSC